MALPIIQVSRGEWGHNWTLDAYGKQFYLGQDGKFCSRVLGMRGSDVVEAIGSNDLRQDKVRRKLARFIINQLELDKEKLMSIEPWGLCCQ
jgi:hypothetical protein